MSIQVWIALSGMAITLGTLIWKLASFYAQGVSNRDAITLANKRIDDLEKLLHSRLEETTSQVFGMRETQARMEEKLNMLLSYTKGDRHT